MAFAVCRAAGSVLQWATCLVWRRGAWGLNIQWLLGSTNGLLVWLCIRIQLLQSCLTLCNPMDCSPLGFSVHGILQSRILEWVAMPSSRGSSWPRDRTCISCLLLWQTDSLPLVPPGKLAWLARELRKTRLKDWWKAGLGWSYIKGPMQIDSNEPALTALEIEVHYLWKSAE